MTSPALGRGFSYGAPRRNRTFNLQIKSLLLYLVELAAQISSIVFLARLAGVEPATL